MIILILTILIVIVATICLIVGYLTDNWYSSDDWCMAGGILMSIGGVVLIIELSFLAMKPLDYKNFKVKYETMQMISTQKDDIRDATYTMKIIEVNEEIAKCKEFENSKWIGIFQNKKICNTSYLEKYKNE